MTNKLKQEVAEYLEVPHDIVVNDYLVKGHDYGRKFYVFIRDPQKNIGFEADVYADTPEETWEEFQYKLYIRIDK